MFKLEIIIKILFSIPKTIFFNFRIFDFFTACKLPIFISNNVSIKGIYYGCISIKCKEIKPFMIKIGIAGSNAIHSQKGLIYLNKKNKGTLKFNGKARFAEGVRIYNNEGTIQFGDNFIANKNCFFSSDEKIEFGNDVLIGWNVNIRDSDGHTIIYENSDKVSILPVIIGNHVWICAEVDILKGTEIGNNCVIAYRSCISNLKTSSNQLVGGYPAKVIKDNINWKK